MTSLCSLGASSTGASGPQEILKPTGAGCCCCRSQLQVTSVASGGKGLHEACSASPGSRRLRGRETQLWSEQLQAPPRTSQACELPFASPLRTVCKRELDIQEECNVLKEALPRLDRKSARPVAAFLSQEKNAIGEVSVKQAESSAEGEGRASFLLGCRVWCVSQWALCMSSRSQLNPLVQVPCMCL